jgi:predicted O-methyltransferase YrrM
MTDLEPIEISACEWTDCRHELRHKAGRAATSFQWAEFGTATGTSAKDLLSVLPEGGHLYLHDSWEGLPKDWDKGNKILPAGAFRGKPPIIERTTIRKGLFSDTLPYDFGVLGLVHIDCDLYESARDALFGCVKNIVPGTVLLFDEFSNIGYPNWREGEYKALCEWREATGHQVKWLGASIGSVFGIVQ